MSQHFKAIGLSFKNTSLKVREALAMDETSAKQLMTFMKDYNCSELLVLSTCNRTEFYYTADKKAEEALLLGLSLIKKISIEDILPHLIRYKTKEAVEHLFRVSVGLEAQVVGDIQIINQVKRSYQWCADEDMAGPFLHRLMHTIFFTNKRVVQETCFRDGAASVSYAAKELVEGLAKGLHDVKVLILGLGEIGEDVARNLFDSNLDITLSNRTREKAETIAAESNFKVIDWSEIGQAIKEADIVISSVGANKPIITKDLIRDSEILSHKFFVDLSVPRSIAQDTEDIHGVVVYNIDEIQNKASETLQKRLNAIPQVEKIVEESIEEFNSWSKEMEVSPTIKKIKNALEQIRQEEMARYLKNATEQEAKILDKLSKSMMQKVMKLPVLQLKAACQRGDAEKLVDVLQELFDLESQIAKK
ncbi:MAG: glutamyl-tRNA reductase [Candidatus Cyclobacteriaceae bacterium M2_1C_046]